MRSEPTIGALCCKAHARRFRAGVEKAGFSVLPGETPIIPVMLGEARLAQDLAQALDERGVFVAGFFFPVVPKGKARIRTQMSAALSDAGRRLRRIGAFADAGGAGDRLKATARCRLPLRQRRDCASGAQSRRETMARELEGKVAVVTGAASGIGLASSEAMLALGARVVMVDRDEAALKRLRDKHGDAVIPLVIDLLDPKDCATLAAEGPREGGPARHPARQRRHLCRRRPGRRRHGGHRPDAQLNVNVVMKNVHDVLPHMIERRTGDIIVTSSLAAHFPTPWEPVYASSKWAINCFVQTVRRQVFKHGIRVGSISPGPVITALLADWPPEKLKEARESGSLLEASEVANVVTFMLTRPRGMTIRDVVMLPTNFDL